MIGRAEGRRRSVQTDLEEVAPAKAETESWPPPRPPSAHQVDQRHGADHQGHADGGGIEDAQGAAGGDRRGAFARLLYRIQRSATTRARRLPASAARGARGRTRAVILIAADKGLCGALNTNVFRLAAQYPVESTIYITAGRKAAQFVAARGDAGGGVRYGDSPTFPEARAIAAFARELFSNGKWTRCESSTTRFVNTLTQEPVSSSTSRWAKSRG